MDPARYIHIILLLGVHIPTILNLLLLEQEGPCNPCTGITLNRIFGFAGRIPISIPAYKVIGWQRIKSGNYHAIYGLKRFRV